MLHGVRRTFLTPFDRSAITDLISSMDDAIDEMQKTAKAITQFEVAHFEPQMRDMAAMAEQGAILVARGDAAAAQDRRAITPSSTRSPRRSSTSRRRPTISTMRA